MATEKVYGPNPRARNIMLGIGLLIVGPLTVFGLIERDSALLLTALIVSAIMLPIFWYALRSARLILTDKGIEARQAGATVATDWSNIAAIRTQRGAEGLVLRQPMTSKGAARLAAVSGVAIGGAPMYDEERRQLLYEQRFIPLDGFNHWLHQGDLHEILMQRATAMDAEPAHALTTPSPPEKMPKKTVALIITIIVCALALGIASAVYPQVKSTVEPIIGVVLMMVIGVFSVKHFCDAVTHLRARRFGSFALMLLIALIYAALALAALGSAID